MTSSFVINRMAVHLDGTTLAITAHDATDAFWADRTTPAFCRGRLLSVFSYTDTWNYRERHPDGDELAVVLEGRVDLLLDGGHGEERVSVARGSACVIPAGAWHRVRVREPATILFVTPTPARTEHQDAPLP